MPQFFEIQAFSIVALLVFGALVSCFETSITAISKAKVYRLASGGNKKAKRIQELLSRRDQVVSVMLLANNVANIAASTLTASLLLQVFGEIGIVYATILLTIVVIIFGEILPKNIAIKSPEGVAFTFSFLIYHLVKIFSPIVKVIQRLVNFPISLLFDKPSRKNKGSDLEEIRDTVDLKAKEGVIFKYDKDLLDGVLDLSDTEISEIMVHRKDVKSLNIDLPIAELVSQVNDLKYTRVPLWKDDKENIIAILNVRKLLSGLYFYNGAVEDFDFASTTSKPWFVPATNSLRTQLFNFRKKGKRFAMVVDEYGSLAGMITLEDIIEEIVGEIKEHDDKSAIGIIQAKSGAYKIPGRILIRDLNKRLELDLPEDEDAHNLSAFIISSLGHIPSEREVVAIGSHNFQVLNKKGSDLVSIRVTAQKP
jgi:Mg2+/Co2+ transporter CorB